MFLLLTGCGKSSKLIRPTDSAETQETTRSGSEAKSEGEKKEEKKTDYMWYVRAAGMVYLIYCVFDMCNKESIPPYKNNDPAPEEFHNPPQGEQQPAGQQNEAINQQESSSDDVSDEYSTEEIEQLGIVITRNNEVLDYSIYNEYTRLRERTPPYQWPIITLPGRSTRLVSKTGRIVKRDHEKRYREKWEALNRKLYPNHVFK